MRHAVETVGSETMVIFTLCGLAWVATCCVLGHLSKVVFCRCFLSPLRHIPAGHPTARFSRLWLTLVRLSRHENEWIRRLHEKLGPVVQLAPDELSYCSGEAIRDLHHGKLSKDFSYRPHFMYFGLGPG